MTTIPKPPRDSAKTQEAMALIRAGEIPYRAALQSGIAPNTIYRALKRERGTRGERVRGGRIIRPAVKLL